MECLPVDVIPEGPPWSHETKLDSYRAEAVKHAGKVTLYSRRKHALNNRFGDVVAALEHFPDETVVDGELVALGEDGNPSFNLLQNFRSMESLIVFYAFDVLTHKGTNVMTLPLSERRKILTSIIRPQDHVGLSEVTTGSAAQILNFVRSHGLEGVIAKRADSIYLPGKRTGLWCKQRVQIGQEFVIGGYVPSHLGVDAIVVGFYRGKDLIYAGRVRACFVPLTRREVFSKLKPLESERCPFANLPEKTAGRWGQGLTSENMHECVWVRPKLVAVIEFLEWTDANHLRHASFVALRSDKAPREVVREDKSQYESGV
jgi:bifunctional non-homologous end joining protein LigD